MTNTIRALQSAIETIENANKILATFGIIMDKKWSDETLNQCKAALSEIEKCEPVAKLGRWMIDKSTGTDILTLDNCSVIKGKYAHYIMGLLQKEIDKVVSELESTSPISKEWVGLTENDILDAWRTAKGGGFQDYAESLEAKLKQLNAPEKG